MAQVDTTVKEAKQAVEHLLQQAVEKTNDQDIAAGCMLLGVAVDMTLSKFKSVGPHVFQLGNPDTGERLSLMDYLLDLTSELAKIKEYDSASTSKLLYRVSSMFETIEIEAQNALEEYNKEQANN